MLTIKRIIELGTPESDTRFSVHTIHKMYGLYAFKVDGMDKTLLVSDCELVQLNHDLSMWYIPKALYGNEHVPRMERPIFVPAHAVMALAFNLKPTEENEKMDDVQTK